MSYRTLSWETCLGLAKGDRDCAWRDDGSVRRWGYNCYRFGGGEWVDVAVIMRDGLRAIVRAGLMDGGHELACEIRLEGRDSVSELEQACIDKVQSLRAQLADAMPAYKSIVVG